VIPPLIVTKYTLPPERPRQVARKSLMERLLAGLDRKCTLIAAPAGFGKSTAAAELARRSGWPAAWLSLDRSDNDPVRWGAYLVQAVRHAGVPVAQPDERPPLDALIATLINGVVACGSPLILVLDDYHLISSSEIHEAVALLLELLPPHFHLVITTRTRPPLPLARLKVRGVLAEITGVDLRFSQAEAAAFLHGVMGLDLPPEGVLDLTARTDGWAAGLQLAALSLQTAPDRAAALRSFNGSNPDLLDYLVDEVIRHQPEAVQTFLLQTSILERLSGPLCEAVTGQPEGHRTLQALEQANLFIFPLDPERRWYRYHPLFAEFLMARLRDQTGAPGVAALHRRAADWFHQRGQFDAAIDHLMEAGNYEQAADWLKDGFADWGARAAPTTLHRWVTQLPEPVLKERPRVAIMAAWALITSSAVQAEPMFTLALDYLDMAARALKQAGAGGADVREVRGVLAAVRIAMAPWAPMRLDPTAIKLDAARAVGLAEEARELLPEDSLLWRSVISNSMGAVFMRASHFAGAARAFGEAARLGVRSGSLTAAITAMQREAQLLIALGQAGRASGVYQEAMRLAAGQNAEALPALAPIYLGMGQLRYEWNELTEAATTLEEAIWRYGTGGASPEALLSLARVRQAQGDAESARALVEQAAGLLASLPSLRAATAAVWPNGVRVLLAQGDVAGARRWVEAAGVEPDPQPDLWRAPEYFALARVLVAEGQAASAVPLLSTLGEIAGATGCRGLEAECRVIEALALHALGEGREARAALRAALELTAAEGLLRLYADGGPAVGAPLVQVAGELRRDRSEGAVLRSYVERLLAILPEDIHGRARVPAPASLPESLTEREQEILQLIATGSSNPDIARELFMGVSTVKWHLLNIFGKLQVRNRTEAVTRARSFGLL
jgi:LuxR family transcriptional regulator, maltose regulon positive regulatory protein